MAHPHRPSGPRHERGPLSWATAVNDSTVEWLAAISRIMAVVWALVGAITLLFLVVQPSLGVGIAVLLAFAYAAACAWLGFVQLGNHEWKAGDDAAE